MLKRAIEEVCPQAFSHIYKDHKPFIEKYIAQQVPLEDEGLDLVHLVFLRLLQGSCKYSGETDIQGYLCGIAKNILREHFRSKRSHIQLNSSVETEIAGDLLVTHSQTEDPSDLLQNAEILQAIRKGVCNLPEKSRQAVELVYFEGFSLPQAAQKAGCTVKVFRARLGHGLALLSMALETR